MPADIEPTTTERALTVQANGQLIRRGADLVYLAESVHLGLFLLASGLTGAGSLISICFAAISSRGITVATLVVATGGLGFTCIAFFSPRRIYLWLRYNQLRQLSPLIVCVGAVLTAGPSWWVALALLWVIASVGSTKLALLAALITSGSFVAGTLLNGGALVHDGYAGPLAGAVGLAANTFVARLMAELFVRFVLRLHQLEVDVVRSHPVPLIVPNLADTTMEERPEPAPARRRAPRPKDRLSRLTCRELEVALLLRDGLRHAEIAVALGVTTRQVERLLQHARERVGASTAAELLAMLVTGRLTPGEATAAPAR